MSKNVEYAYTAFKYVHGNELEPTKMRYLGSCGPLEVFLNPITTFPPGSTR